MARLSAENLKDRGRFRFKQEEVELPQVVGDDDEPGTVLVRAPSVQQRDEIAKQTPDDVKDWTVENSAFLCSVIVVDPKLSKDEWAEFLGDFPAEGLDEISRKFNQLTGADKKEMRKAAGEFRSPDED